MRTQARALIATVVFVVAIAAVIAVAGSGPEGSAKSTPRNAPSTSPSNSGRPPATCLSADEPGVITCSEAIDAAWEQEGSPGIPESVDAILTTVQLANESTERKVWVVTFRYVPFDPSAGGCLMGDYAVYVDAETALFISAGTSGPSRGPCPTATPNP